MICKYQCWRCKFKWKGYRVVPVKNERYEVVQYLREKGPGLTVCPRCKHDKLTWTNYESFAKWLSKQKG